eukprot:3735832-Prymnesium_polylepis.1
MQLLCFEPTGFTATGPLCTCWCSARRPLLVADHILVTEVGGTSHAAVRPCRVRKPTLGPGS